MKKIDTSELYLVSAMGRDVSGLIALITSIISGLNGNIVDIEENVVHGIFSIFLVVDLAQSKAGLEELKVKMEDAANQTDLKLMVEKISKGEESPKNLISILLIGKDHPGIVSKAAVFLANHGINIEKTIMVAKGKLFAMEMLMDIKKCHIPLKEVENNFRNKMEEIDIQVFFLKKNIYKGQKDFIILNDVIMKSKSGIKKLKKIKVFRDAYKLLHKKAN